FPGSVSGAFSAYWWIPIVGPLVGGAIGILVYDLFIGDVLIVRSELAELPPPGRSRPVHTHDEE
ncbi:aquaporin, partial [Streptomyces sp. SID161]|nr:aquaporin [Streptomyces sp. SID161]